MWQRKPLVLSFFAKMCKLLCVCAYSIYCSHRRIVIGSETSFLPCTTKKHTDPFYLDVMMALHSQRAKEKNAAIPSLWPKLSWYQMCVHCTRVFSAASVWPQFFFFVAYGFVNKGKQQFHQSFVFLCSKRISVRRKDVFSFGKMSEKKTQRLVEIDKVPNKKRKKKWEWATDVELCLYANNKRN